MRAERPSTAGAINAYADALARAAAARYPGDRTSGMGWRCGWAARRNGEPASKVRGAAAFGLAYCTAWMRGWEEAGGAWGTVEEAKMLPSAQGALL